MRKWEFKGRYAESWIVDMKKREDVRGLNKK